MIHNALNGVFCHHHSVALLFKCLRSYAPLTFKRINPGSDIIVKFSTWLTRWRLDWDCDRWFMVGCC